MPRRKFGVSPDAANAEPISGFAQYNGPVGMVKGLLKNLHVVPSKSSDNSILKFFVEVREPKGSKLAAHNGQTIWGQQTITHAGAGFVNGMLQGIGVSQKDITVFWGAGPMVEKADATGREKLMKIGTFVVDPAGIPVAVNVIRKPASTGEDGKEYPEKMEVGSFLLPGQGTVMPTADSDEEDDDVEDAITTPAAEDDEEEDDVPAADDEEEDDEEEGDDPFDARTDELEALKKAGDRPALRSIAKGHEIQVFKSMSNDDIINAILGAEFPESAGSGPAEDDEEEDDVPAAEPAPKAAGRSPRADRNKPPF
jgi:hypothetical protein